ncbi:hypothetical protein CHS0354_009723 [Potamilus streckersoni]|uniref:Mitochondria-eating protein C-terminal domain-containing protein n=1 Tax=Potamilus streckersoni TaxID=2493646 RepID=A0AAE0VMC5_9BIVA|nr:hypothetical protein CHS0354_009723 [Potamilus streckersoni]
MISSRMSKRPEQSFYGTGKDTRRKDQNGEPLKTMRIEAGQHQSNTSEETASEEKILPMSDKEEKMINYREQVEEMRRKIKTLEETNRTLESKLSKENLKVTSSEPERKSSFKRHLPWKNERPKTDVFPSHQNLGSETTELSKQKDVYMSQIRQLQDEKVKLCGERDALGAKLKQYENDLCSVKEENRIATVTISKLMKEKDDLQNRLSEIGSDRLTHENTDIVDLSDENRPGKLREKIAEMYNYQWTEALNELEKNELKNENAIQLLLKILMETHLACKEVTWNRYTKLLEDCSSINVPWKLESDAKGEDNGVIVNVELTLNQKRHIKQICFGTSKQLESKIKSMLMKMVEIRTNFHEKHMEKTRKYLEDCIEICWRMTLQEKPMHLETSVEIRNGQKHFDNEKFRAYTKTGQYVDFVVWPAIYLFEGGPILERGVAQGLSHKESQSVQILND